MKLFAITVLLSLLSGIAAAQTLSIGIEQRAEIVPSWPEPAHDVQLASVHLGFAAVWRTGTGNLVVTMINAFGQPAATVTPLSPNGRNPRITGTGHGFLTAWQTESGHEISVAPVYDDGSKGLELVPVTDYGLDGTSIRLGAAGYRCLLVWITGKGQHATLFAVVLNPYGERISRTITISEDAGVSNPSVARAGANFVVAFRTARGIETALIDSRGGSVATGLVSGEHADAMMVVSAPGGPVVLYTPAGTSATYGIAPAMTGEAPQFIAQGRFLTAVATSQRPIIALSMRDGRVALFQPRPFRGAREVIVPGAQIETAESMAWNGTFLLVASGRTSTEIIRAGLEGQTGRKALLGFRFTNRHLIDVATAGGVDLLAWFDSIEDEDVDDEGPFTPVNYAFGRFRDTVALDGGGVRTIRNPVVASDGLSAFLIGGVRDGSSTAVAQIVPVVGARLPLIDLGEGEVLDAIRDGADFLVFWKSSTRRFVPEVCASFDTTVHASRIRSDGTILSPAGGSVLLTGENISWLEAAPTRAGFVLAYNSSTCNDRTRTRIVAFNSALTTIRAIDPILIQSGEQARAISIAGNGTDRVMVGIESKLLDPGSQVSRRTLMLNERGEQQWSAKEVAHASVALGDGFVLFFPRSGYWNVVDAILRNDDESLPDVSAGTNRASFETFTAVHPPLAATSPQRTIVAYARLATLPGGEVVRRLITRTISLLPKGESPP